MSDEKKDRAGGFRWISESGRKHPVWMALVCCIPALLIPSTLFYFGWNAEELRNLAWGFGSYLAAVMAVLAAYLTNRRTNELSRQNDIAARRADEFLRQNDIAEQGQITGRHAQASEQLGHENSAVRMAGLYALDRLAKEAGERGQAEEEEQIIDLIAGFVRARAPAKLTAEGEKKRPRERRAEDYEAAIERHKLIDVEAAVEILGKKNEEEDSKSWQMNVGG